MDGQQGPIDNMPQFDEFGHHAQSWIYLLSEKKIILIYKQQQKKRSHL